MRPLTPTQVQAIAHSADAQHLSADARERLTWISQYACGRESIGAICRHFGMSRSTFHRWLNRFDPDNLASLETNGAGNKEPAVTSHVLARIRMLRQEHPFMGKTLLAEKLRTAYGLNVSASAIGRAIERHCLYFGKSPLHVRKRLQHAQEELQPLQPLASANTTPVIAPPAHPALSPRSHLRRTLLLASIAINIVFVSMLLGAALWEMIDLSEHGSETIQAATTPLVQPLSTR